METVSMDYSDPDCPGFRHCHPKSGRSGLHPGVTIYRVSCV